MNSRRPFLVALLAASALTLSCSPGWDGKVAEYALPEEAPDRGDSIKRAPDEHRWHPCEVMVDERCIRSFAECSDRFVPTADHADSFECAAALRDSVCWPPQTSPPRGFHWTLGERCVTDIVQADGCDEVAAILDRCDDELWQDSTCTRTVEPGSTSLSLPSDGAGFNWSGSYVSVCLEVDVTRDLPLDLRTDSPGRPLDTLLFLYGPDGEDLGINDDDPDRQGLLSRLVVSELEVSGLYTIVVAGYDAEHSGDVVLEVSVGP